MLALAGSMWLASGCAGSGKFSRPQWLSFGKKEETGPKVVTPRDKMEQLRELAKRGPKMAPDLQERASNELAQGIAHEQDPILRAQILRTLASFPTEKSATILVAGLHDHERDVRIAACEALGKHGGLAAGPNLSRRWPRTLTSTFVWLRPEGWARRAMRPPFRRWGTLSRTRTRPCNIEPWHR